LRSAGFRGFLIGEMLMKTSNPGKTLRDLVQQITE
jgi:indole-3-glycerol phosphate synthase